MQHPIKELLLNLRNILLLFRIKIPITIPLYLLKEWFWSLTKCNISNINQRYFHAKRKIYLEYLYKKYSKYLPDTLVYQYIEPEKVESLPIWVLWYQGVENAPSIVKLCLKQLKRIEKKRPIIILDKSNLPKYIDIPKVFEQEIKSNRLSLTHMSDFIRTYLLYRYGGLWMDATLLAMSHPLSCIELSPLFSSIKIRPLSPNEISNYRWATFCMFCYPQSSVMKFLFECLQQYVFDNHKGMMDYLLIDYFIELLYCHNNEFKKIIDSSSYCNQNLYEIQECLLENKKIDNKILSKGLYKLNRRFENEESNIAFHIIRDYIDNCK